MGLANGAAKLKHEQPRAPGRQLQGAPNVTEFTTYQPYTEAELVDLGKQFLQRLGELLAAGLLQLWDLGVDGIICSVQEMEKFASLTTHPSLHQQLQNSQRHRQGNHSFLDWVMAAMRTVWAGAGDIPKTVSKWHSFADLVQVLCELSTHQAMFSVNTCGPDDEWFTAGMQYLVLQNAPSSTFDSLMAILAPYIRCLINEVTAMVASLGETETQRQQREVHVVMQPGPLKGKRQGRAPQKVTWTQMWVDLLAAGIDRAKTDGQSNAYLLELWKQLKPEQQYTNLWTAKAAPVVWAVCLEDHMFVPGVDPMDDGLPFKYD